MKLEMVFNLSRQFVLKVREKNTKCPILMAVDTYSPLLTINSVKEIEEVLKTQGEKALKGYKAAKKNNMFNDLLGEFCTFLRDQDATLVILSQLKRKIGVVFGDDKTSNADNIMRYYATLRIRGTLGSKIIKKTKINGKEVKRKIGVISHWETIKNRNVSPFRQCSVKILYKEGIDRISGLQELMINEGIVEGVEGKPKKISYDGKITTIKKLLESNPELFEKLPE
jgi:RecA/RadA recombinase